MSYDLMVFEKAQAPNNKTEFIKWYENQVEWKEDHNYDSIEVSSANLKNWFMENDEDLANRITDYCIGKDVIYACFAWSLAEDAYNTMLKIALKHGVGFFDVSGNGEIILSECNEHN